MELETAVAFILWFNLTYHPLPPSSAAMFNMFVWLGSKLLLVVVSILLRIYMFRS